MDQEFEALIDQALTIATEIGIDIYTFAFYHDHESKSVSICLDTELNSIAQVKRQNKYNAKYFNLSIQQGDLKKAALWQANPGRNLSLGDFTAVNIVEKHLPEDYVIDANLYLSMIKAVNAKINVIQALCGEKEKLVCCCSTAEEEVGLIWVPGKQNEKENPARRMV